MYCVWVCGCACSWPLVGSEQEGWVTLAMPVAHHIWQRYTPSSPAASPTATAAAAPRVRVRGGLVVPVTAVTVGRILGVRKGGGLGWCVGPRNLAQPTPLPHYSA